MCFSLFHKDAAFVGLTSGSNLLIDFFINVHCSSRWDIKDQLVFWGDALADTGLLITEEEMDSILFELLFTFILLIFPPK